MALGGKGLPLKKEISFFSRVISMFCYWKNRLQSKYDVVHLRGFMPLPSIASLLRTPFIYDIRAFIGEWVDIGKIKEHLVGTFINRIGSSFS